MANEPDLIEIHINPPDLFTRFERYPKQLDKEIGETMEAAYLHVWGSVPAYPPKPPNSSYERKVSGGIGGSLGVGEGGGKAGFNKHHVKSIKKLGAGKHEVRFGSRIHYAPDVIGTHTQKPLFKKIGWWTMRDVKNKAEPGIIKLFKAMTDRLVKHLGG